MDMHCSAVAKNGRQQGLIPLTGFRFLFGSDSQFAVDFIEVVSDFFLVPFHTARFIEQPDHQNFFFPHDADQFFGNTAHGRAVTFHDGPHFPGHFADTQVFAEDVITGRGDLAGVDFDFRLFQAL